MTGLVLAAGMGSRLFGTGSAKGCKALETVGGRPLIAYSLDNLRRLDVTDAVIVIGKDHRALPLALGDDYRGLKLRYAVQPAPVGLVNAMLCAAPQLQSDVVLQLSDEIFLQPGPPHELLDAFAVADFLVGYTRADAAMIRRNYSVETDAQGWVAHCTEKPAEAPNDRKGTGFCLFSADCFRLLEQAYDPNANVPNDLCDFINLLAAAGKRGRAVPVAQEEINVNTPDDLRCARARLEQNR